MFKICQKVRVVKLHPSVSNSTYFEVINKVGKIHMIGETTYLVKIDGLDFYLRDEEIKEEP